MADPEKTVVCRCFGLTEARLREAIGRDGLRTLEAVRDVTGASGGCGSCAMDVEQLLDTIHGRARSIPSPGASGLPSQERKRAIRELLAQELTALFRANGVEPMLVDVMDGDMLMRFTGEAVGTTRASWLALKWRLVERASEKCGRRMALIELNALGK